MENYTRVGSEWEGTPDAFALHLDDYATKLIPPTSVSVGDFDPGDCFITSGDATQKTTQLIEDLGEYLQRVQSTIAGATVASDDASEFEAKVRATIDRITQMRADLEKVRGTAIFLETEWVQGILICIPKNPRPRK